MRHRPSSRRVVLLAAPAALALLVTTACSAFSEDSASEGFGSGSGAGAVTVAAAFYPLQYVVERVGGDRVAVAGLTTLGQEPHDLEPSIEETSLIASADLVVHEQGFQPALDEAIEQNASGEVLDAAGVVDLVPFAEEGHSHSDDGAQDAAEDAADDAADDAAEDTAEDGDEESHDGELDPHFWLDPTLLAQVGSAVADDLAEIDPDHAADYAAGARDLRADLDDLDASYSTGLSGCARDVIVVSHDAFGYLGARYGLEVAGVAGLTPDAEPTPAVLADLQDLIREDGITTVFSERLASPALTRSLADDAGVTTEVLDPLEGLTDQTADDDYLSLMERNLQVLRRANGCPAS